MVAVSLALSSFFYEDFALAGVVLAGGADVDVGASDGKVAVMIAFILA